MWKAVAERSYAHAWELRSKVVGSIPGHARNFSTPDCKKNQHDTLSQGYRNFLWLESYKGVDRASALPESLLHQIIIVIIKKI